MPTVNFGPLSVTFSLSNLLLGVIGVTTSIGGMSGQIIALNFWLNGFSTVDSPFTVLTLVAMTVAVVYSAGLAIWAFKKRPKLRFAIQPGCIIFGLACGFCYSLNGLLLVYATPDTPELIQVMLISTGVFWTFFTACFVHLFKVGCRAACRLVDRRALMVPFAFALCAGGIVLGAGSFNMTSLSYDEKKWTIIFAVAQIPGAVFNVMAAEYMNLYSDPSDINLNTTAGTISQPNLDDDRLDDQLNSYSLVNPYAPKRYTSDPTTVKMMLLAVSAVGQMFCLWAYFPVNWIDGFGADGTAEVARANLATNYQCVFFGCPASTNFWYFVAFAISYAATLVGSAILNHFSAPLCSMVTQVATPFADLILVIFPVLNVDKQPYNVGDVIGALILITVGSIVYVVWSRFMQPVEEPLPPQQQQYVVYPPAPQQQMLYQQVVVQQFVVEQHRVVEGCESA